MAKLTKEDKIEIYKKKKEGKSYTSLSSEYGVHKENIKYLVRLIEYHGEEILRKDKNNYYSKELKEEIINNVLIDGESVKSTSIKYGLTSGGLLSNWIRAYKENNCVIVEKTRGRKSNTMTQIKNKESKVDYDSLSDKEKIKYLENKNIELEAEAEYQKKLRAVVQKRIQRQKTK